MKENSVWVYRSIFHKQGVFHETRILPPPPTRRGLTILLFAIFLIPHGIAQAEVYYLNSYTQFGESWDTTSRWTLYGSTQTYEDYKGLSSLDVNGSDIFLVGSDTTYTNGNGPDLRAPEASPTLFPVQSSLYIGYVWDETTSSPRISQSSNTSMLQPKAEVTTIDNLYLGNGRVSLASPGSQSLYGTATIEGYANMQAYTDRWLSLYSTLKGAGTLNTSVHYRGMFILGDNADFEGNWVVSLYGSQSNGYLQVGNATTTSSLGKGTVSLANGTSLVFQAPGAMVVDNAISGAGKVEWRGAGRLTLGGKNAYTGSTTVTTGSLAVTGTLASTVTMGQGTTFDILPTENGTLGGLTLEEEASINVFLGREMTPLTIAGVLTLDVDSLITFQFDDPLTGGLAFDILSAEETVMADGSPVDWSQILDFSQVGGANLWNYSLNDGILSVAVDSAAVPEPSSWILLGLGVVWYYWRWQGKNKK